MRFEATLINRAARRVRASDGEIARSLQGTWRPEHLVAWRQALDAFDFWMSGRTKRCANRAAQALLAAAALRTSQSALGACCHRLRARMDKPKAVTAAAHELAQLINSMLTQGEEYQCQASYEERYRQRVRNNLNKRAQQ